MPNQDNQTVEKDIDEFCQKVRLREIFGLIENFDDHKVQNKKGKTILKGRNNYKVFIVNSNPVKHNLPVKQKNALQNQKIEDAIILMEADKGGTIVCMDKTIYKTLLQHLSNDQFYVK